MAQTSERVSKIAANLINITDLDVMDAASSPDKVDSLVKDIRALAASTLRQDETKGSRFARLLGLGKSA